MKLKVRYLVIYTVEILRKDETSLLAQTSYEKAVLPCVWDNTGKKSTWQITERNKFKIGEDAYGAGIVWGSRKYVATLTADELKEFAEQFGVSANETCHTMGALTVEYGLTPAISWDCRDTQYNGYLCNAYVSPLVGTGEDFDKIEAAYGENTAQLELFRHTRFTPLFESVMDVLDNLENGEYTLGDDDFEFPSELTLENVGQLFLEFDKNN